MENRKCNDNNIMGLHMLLYFIFCETIFFIWSNVISNLFIGKRRLADTWHYSHIPILLSHCISCFTPTVFVLQVFIWVLCSSIFAFGLKPICSADPQFFFYLKIQAHFLALPSTDRYLIKWELEYGCAVPYELYECKVLVYNFTLPALSFSLFNVRWWFSNIRICKNYLGKLVKLADSRNFAEGIKSHNFKSMKKYINWLTLSPEVLSH